MTLKINTGSIGRGAYVALSLMRLQTGLSDYSPFMTPASREMSYEPKITNFLRDMPLISEISANLVKPYDTVQLIY